jgi:DNA-directed RNA polymerase specialized sigma24 family protein
MTSKHRRGLLRPRRQRTITTYGVHALDNLREEVMPRYHRDASVDDPWLNPSKSEAVRALLVLIAHAMAHTPQADSQNDIDLDLRLFCVDAKLTDRQMEVVLMVAEGWGILTIASWLGISRQAVSRHLSLGRGKLARQVPPIDPYYRKEFPKQLPKAYCGGGELRQSSA